MSCRQICSREFVLSVIVAGVFRGVRYPQSNERIYADVYDPIAGFSEVAW